MASYIRPSTRAVSATDSLCPSWDPDGSRYVTWAPWSKEATSKADRVRVEVFSKMRAISLPSSRLASLPAYFAVFSASDRASRCRSSCGSKSISFTKLRLRRLYMPWPFRRLKRGERSTRPIGR